MTFDPFFQPIRTREAFKAARAAEAKIHDLDLRGMAEEDQDRVLHSLESAIQGQRARIAAERGKV